MSDSTLYIITILQRSGNACLPLPPHLFKTLNQSPSDSVCLKSQPHPRDKFDRIMDGILLALGAVKLAIRIWDLLPAFT